MFVKNLILAFYCVTVAIATNELRQEGKNIAGGIFLFTVTAIALIS